MMLLGFSLSHVIRAAIDETFPSLQPVSDAFSSPYATTTTTTTITTTTTTTNVTFNSYSSTLQQTDKSLL